MPRGGQEKALCTIAPFRKEINCDGSFNALIYWLLRLETFSLQDIQCVSFQWFVFSIQDHCSNCPVGWGCRIHWLHLCRGVRPPNPNEFPGYDTKQSDGEVPAVLELWGMRSTPSLPLLPGPLWPGVVAPDRALSMG